MVKYIVIKVVERGESVSLYYPQEKMEEVNKARQTARQKTNDYNKQLEIIHKLVKNTKLVKNK